MFTLRIWEFILEIQLPDKHVLLLYTPMVCMWGMEGEVRGFKDPWSHGVILSLEGGSKDAGLSSLVLNLPFLPSVGSNLAKITTLHSC